MRDCVFLVADKNMEAVFRGFLEREFFFASLGCGPFDFDAEQDLYVGAGLNDPGLYLRGHELLRGFQASHRHAMLALDATFAGSPGQAAIEETVTDNLVASGWHRASVVVIVIQPELEAWVWVRSAVVARAFGFAHFEAVRSWLEGRDLWPAGTAKPPEPKRAVEAALEYTRTRRSSALYRRIVEQVSPRSCADPAFIKLRDTLRGWFPAPP